MLQNIALCFSGGGYRAAGFSLGILSYFNHVEIIDPATQLKSPLLDNINGLSTVSGGTLTGVIFTLFKANERSFEDFYAFFYEFLDDDLLLEKALTIMEDDEIWKHTFKKQSLINAFSIAYRELLTEETFADLEPAEGSLADFCFNATEFTNGLAFRFQNNGLFGNYYFRDKDGLQNHKGDFYLADIIASSSCFPLGFEPLTMPNDYFAKDSITYKQLMQDADFRAGVGIMDGGIVDNQGIGSTILADKRKKENNLPQYDLILNCDVGSGTMPPWAPSTTNTDKTSTIDQLLNKAGSWLKNNVLPTIFIILGAAGIIFGLLTPLCISDWALVFGSFLLMSGVLLFLGKYLVLYFYKFLHNKMKAVIPHFYEDKLKAFDQIGLGVLKRMITERLTSGSSMINYVFLNQIRRLNYDLFYKSDDLEGRRASALINALTKEKYTESKLVYKNMNAERTLDIEVLKHIPEPSTAIFNSAEIAASFGTTLWFVPADRDVQRLKNLVACGQFTACYTLLKFVIRTELTTDTPIPELKPIKEALLKDWEAFIKDPFVFLEHD